VATVKATLLADGAVLGLLLDQPRANILSLAMMTELAAALEAHRDDKALKLVFLRGAGGNFSFGASVPEHTKEAAPAMLAGFHALIRAVARFPVPVASLVEGRCLGGAFELVLASHLVFATERAVFACPEIKLGVLPPVLGVLGHHRLGGALAERMLLTGCELSAPKALTAGFVADVLPADAEPEAWLLAWFAENLAPLSSFSLREATLAAREGSGLFASLGAPLDAAEARYKERLLPSHDGNEGIEAFLAKRAPIWTGA
jgi:cyclohexa-1,5-dienecarbonyl-CoA hydratase